MKRLELFFYLIHEIHNFFFFTMKVNPNILKPIVKEYGRRWSTCRIRCLFQSPQPPPTCPGWASSSRWTRRSWRSWSRAGGSRAPPWRGARGCSTTSPTTGTRQGVSFLFPKARGASSKFNPHDPEVRLYEINMKGGASFGQLKRFFYLFQFCFNISCCLN